MELLVLIRPFFQLVNQYINGFTYLFSLAFFACFIRDCAKGSLRFGRFEIIALCYFVLSIGISLLAGAAAGTMVGQFNKLFVCLFAFLAIKRLPMFPLEGKSAVAVRALTYLSSLYVLISLAIPSSYQELWGVRTFQMTFSSQHEAAALITLLIALVGYDLKRYDSRVFVRLLVSTGLLFALLMTGARTITIAGSVIYLLQLLSATKRIDRRLRGILLVLAAVVVVVSVLPALSSTALFEKNKVLAKELGIENRCEFHGWVSGSDREALFERAAVYCLPSKNEGLPMSLLEAMARGIPAVATPVGGIPQVIDDGVNGMLVPVGNYCALATALCEALDSSELRKNMGYKAREKVHSIFDIDMLLGELSEIYCNVAADL